MTLGDNLTDDELAKISTHTLTWSVTLGDNLTDDELAKISTHTLTWSVTACLVLSAMYCAISTHTLTWSVTRFAVLITTRTGFQLTRSRGA